MSGNDDWFVYLALALDSVFDGAKAILIGMGGGLALYSLQARNALPAAMDIIVIIAFAWFVYFVHKIMSFVWLENMKSGELPDHLQ